MKNGKTGQFLAKLRELKSKLRPHINLGQVAFAKGQKGELLMPYLDGETYFEDEKFPGGISTKEAESLLHEAKGQQSKRASAAEFSAAKRRGKASATKTKQPSDGSVVRPTWQRVGESWLQLKGPSLAEMACRELSRGDIKRFVIATDMREITPLEYQQFESRFLGILRRILNRELTTIIKNLHLPNPVRGKTNIRLQLAMEASNLVAKYGGMGKTEAVRRTARIMVCTEMTVWRYLRLLKSSPKKVVSGIRQEPTQPRHTLRRNSEYRNPASE